MNIHLCVVTSPLTKFAKVGRKEAVSVSLITNSQLELDVLTVPGNKPARVLQAAPVHDLHHLLDGVLSGEELVLGHPLVVGAGEVGVRGAGVEAEAHYPLLPSAVLNGQVLVRHVQRSFGHPVPVPAAQSVVGDGTNSG